MMTLLDKFSFEFLSACLGMLGEKEASISIGKQRFSINGEEGASISTVVNDGPIDITCSSQKMKEMIQEKLSLHKCGATLHSSKTLESVDKIIKGPLPAWMGEHYDEGVTR